MPQYPNNHTNTRIALNCEENLLPSASAAPTPVSATTTKIRILFLSVEVDNIKLQAENVEPCRAMLGEPPSAFLLVSFKNFRLEVCYCVVE